MRGPSHGRLRQQVDTLRRQFLQEGGLPFADVLSPGCLAEALGGDQGALEGPDLHPAGDPLGLPRPGAQRRPVLPRRRRPPDRPPRRAGAAAVQLRDGGLLPGAGSACPSGSSPPWPASSGGTWTRGSTGGGSGRAAASACSTARRSPCPTRRRTAREYPLAYNQVPGTNFALARIGAIISLSCGAILDLGICRYAGKGQGEVSLLRRLWDVLRPGDVLLGDRLMSGWVGMHLLKQRGRRHRQPPVGAPPGRLPQGDPPGQGRPPRACGRSRRRSARWTGRRTTRCPTRSRSARSASGWSSPGSGPGRSWS